MNEHSEASSSKNEQAALRVTSVIYCHWMGLWMIYDECKRQTKLIQSVGYVYSKTLCVNKNVLCNPRFLERAVPFSPPLFSFRFTWTIGIVAIHFRPLLIIEPFEFLFAFLSPQDLNHRVSIHPVKTVSLMAIFKWFSVPKISWMKRYGVLFSHYVGCLTCYGILRHHHHHLQFQIVSVVRSPHTATSCV